MAEAIYLVRNARAEKIVIDREQFESMSADPNVSFDFGIPQAVPVLGNPGYGGAANCSGEHTDAESATAESIFLNLLYMPHVKFGWFYCHGAREAASAMVCAALETDGKNPHTIITAHFASDDTVQSLMASQLMLAKTVGVGMVHTSETKTKSEFDLKVTFRFFDSVSCEEVSAWREGNAKANEVARRSLSMLATLRAEFYEVSTGFREDLKLHTEKGLDIPHYEATNNALLKEANGRDTEAMGSETMREMTAAEEEDDDEEGNDSEGTLVTEEEDEEEGDDTGAVQTAQAAQAALATDTFLTSKVRQWQVRQSQVRQSQVRQSGKMLTVPFTLYGPEGSGRTSVLYTWTMSILKSPHLFLADGGHCWREMKRNANCRYRRFLRGIKFDPTRNSGKNEEALGEVDDETYHELSDKNLAQVIMYDTNPAKDPYVDTSDRALPFGIRILVLDYNVAADAFERSKTTNVVDFTSATLKLLGRKYEADEARRGDLHRYPPMVTILAKCMSLPGSSGYGDVEKVVEWVKNLFSLAHVYAMPTFTPPSAQEKQSRFAKNARGSRGEYRSESEWWMKTAIAAIRVLSKVIANTASHEQLAVQRLLIKQKRMASSK